jgi:hypothetical protein
MNFNQVDDVPLIIDAAAWAENEVGIKVVSLTVAAEVKFSLTT